ncbi:MAG: hypothetical protein ACHQ4J_12050 [Candidatus Binatia bacterium]
MAKKKAVRKKVEPGTVLSRLQSGLKKMQRDAEALLGRARKEAVRLSGDQKRALNRVVSEAKRFRSDAQKIAKRTAKDLEARSKRLLSTLEKDVEKRIEPVVNRLVGPSRQEVQDLTRRVHQLEQSLQQHSHTATALPPPPPPLVPSDAVSPAVGD